MLEFWVAGGIWVVSMWETVATQLADSMDGELHSGIILSVTRSADAVTFMISLCCHSRSVDSLEVRSYLSHR
jgi:hypothetical protein